MIVIEKEVLICQWTKKKNWSRFRVVLTKENKVQGGNINALRQQSDYFTCSPYQEMKGAAENAN